MYFKHKLLALTVLIGLFVPTGCSSLCTSNRECDKGIDIIKVPPLNVKNLEIIDPEKGTLDSANKLRWYDVKDLTIEGKGWQDTETFYERLPKRVKPDLTPMVRTLCTHTAGIAVRFVTNATKIKADWTVGGFDMKHMAWTGIRGLDLYASRDGQWVFEGTARPKDNRTTATFGIFLPDMPAEITEFFMYLPLYDRVKELKIGVPEDCIMAKGPSRSSDRAKPIVFYGTSITQGGCASRTGMCHAALLGRWLDREVINLGFSGSGQMEPVMADMLAELDPELYVLECLPNMTPEMVAERVEPFVKRLREAHPLTRILLVENPFNALENKGNIELRKIYKSILEQNIAEVYYLPGEGLLEGLENGTVDGVHPTDLGFIQLATAYYPVVKKLLR